MGGKKIKSTDKLTIACFSLGFASGGWQRKALIPLVYWGRAINDSKKWNLIEKSLVKKYWEWGEENGKTKQTHRCLLLSGICKQGMAATGFHSPCRLRKCRWHQQQDSNLIEKSPVRKHWEWGGVKNEANRQTHHNPLLSWICERGMAAVGSYSPCRLREDHWCQQQNSNLIEKSNNEKLLGMGGKKMKRTDKLTLAHFSLRYASGGWQRQALILLVD